MGLDNGLILHSKNLIPADQRPPMVSAIGMHESYIYDGPEFDYEIIYWRKCWNLRAEVAKTLDLPLDNVQAFDLSIDNIKQIWNIINQSNNKHYWKEHNNSIWSYKEMRNTLDDNLFALEWLIYFMRNHREEDYQIEFYDSY